jgi:hypothetical protein
MKAENRVLTRVAFFGAVFVVVGGPSPQARATIVVPRSLTELAEGADVVAHVAVGEVTALVEAGVPYRVTELTVIEGFQGTRAGERFLLRQRGTGSSSIVGDPRLQSGQEGLVFLRLHQGRAYLSSLAQSFWRLSRRADGLWARRDVRALNFVRRAQAPVLPPNRLPWHELRRLVLGACQGRLP